MSLRAPSYWISPIPDPRFHRILIHPLCEPEGGVELPQIAPLSPRFGGLNREPSRELIGIGVQLARTRLRGVARRFFARSQVLLCGVARQACTPGYLADGHLLAQGPASDDTRCRHVYHS
jgi:hypothetical protein